jgi:hypothetical protein
MRKALIAAAVATALFAVGAFAASFAVQSEDIASGSDDVTACAAQVDIDFADPVLNQATGAWTVANATARFRDGSDALVTTCGGYAAELALKLGGTPATAQYSLTTYAATVGAAANNVVFSFGATPIDVTQIHGASLVVDGKTLAADVANLP